MFNSVNLHYVLAGTIGFIFPIPIVYFINSMWSFNYKIYNFKSLKIYFILNLTTLVCHIFLIIFFKSILGWQEEICQLSGIFVSAIINFTLLKLFLFDKK
jgi:putative flippase GtrA